MECNILSEVGVALQLITRSLLILLDKIDVWSVDNIRSEICCGESVIVFGIPKIIISFLSAG